MKHENCCSLYPSKLGMAHKFKEYQEKVPAPLNTQFPEALIKKIWKQMKTIFLTAGMFQHLSKSKLMCS